MNETEHNITTEEAKVADALRAMPKVHAPMGFESGVKARIASGVGPARRPFFFRPVFTLPAAAAIAIGVFVALQSGGGEPGRLAQSVPPVTEPVARVEAPLQDSAPKEVETAETSPGRKDSVDYQVIERGAEAAQVGEGPVGAPYSPQPKAASSTRAVEFFGGFGASVYAGGQGLTVTRVTSGSAAERAGLKAGDILLAVDGVRLSGDIPLPVGFRGTILQVTRPGEEKPLLIQLR